MNKKKLGIILVIAAVVVAAIIGGIVFFLKGGSGLGNAKDKVYVEKVGTLNYTNLSRANSYSGVVESQETSKVNRDADKTVKEVLVSVGDNVEVGTPLFTYDTEELVNKIAQTKLEMESIANDITNYNAQITELQKEKENAPQDQQFEYTTQIQTIQMSIKQAEFDKKGKQADIDKDQKAIDNATVTSKTTGVVKTINESGVDANGNSSAYMTILATGEYRVKGTIDEMNVYNLNVGQDVVIRSRVDETQTWKGTISAIDTENTEGNENDKMGYSYGGESGESASKYPFYITLESTDGLILGQHVYIEPGDAAEAPTEGLWIPDSYVVINDGDPYVWAANKKDRLEKRKVELGEHNEDIFLYEIISGITEDDYITWPMEALYEGVTAVTDESKVDYSSPLYNPTGEDSINGVEGQDYSEPNGDSGIPDGMENGLIEDGDHAGDVENAEDVENGVEGDTSGMDEEVLQ